MPSPSSTKDLRKAHKHAKIAERILNDYEHEMNMFADHSEALLEANTRATLALFYQNRATLGR